MKVTALLPMKGHSERISNKNMRLMAGLPLYRYVAKVLEDSPYIESILINTDSNIIAEDAQQNFSKVQIIKRPQKLHGDEISMNKIIEYDISTCSRKTHFVQTHSTNPLLKRTTLEKAIESYFDNITKFNSLFAVTKLQTRLYWKDLRPVNHNPQQLLRTQDLTPLFEENSNFYIFSHSSFESAGGNRIGQTPQMFPMNKLEAIDIDEEEDFILAEMLIKTRKSLV
ncbi:MAG: acylneuraminate cytidylyltransferase family protein [Desulfamplus sp.]|nr:acylneuraminate cytidylyltransferase family protein [Desulfamplus sp.]